MKFYHRYVCPGTNIYIAFVVLWFQACSGSLGTCPPWLRVDCWARVSFSFHQLLPHSWLAPPAPNHHLPVQMVRVRSWWIPWFLACPSHPPVLHTATQEYDHVTLYETLQGFRVHVTFQETEFLHVASNASQDLDLISLSFAYALCTNHLEFGFSSLSTFSPTTRYWLSLELP